MDLKKLRERLEPYSLHILLAVIVLLAIVSVVRNPDGADCYTDWDGRSNPTVCE